MLTVMMAYTAMALKHVTALAPVKLELPLTAMTVLAVQTIHVMR